MDRDLLVEKVGFSADPDFIPLYGDWISPDDVHIRFTSALVQHRGAVKSCQEFSKRNYHELWLPLFGSDGDSNLNIQETDYDPLIWVPEHYPVGIDNRDEWATSRVLTRPRLGLPLNESLGLKEDDAKRQWFDKEDKNRLQSTVWGRWEQTQDSRTDRYQEEGSILYCDRKWMDEVLMSRKQRIVYKFAFYKSKSRYDYDESAGIHQIYVGLKRPNQPMRIWHAKNASE